ncbi:Probable pectin methyltransferase qua2 [Dionaea muscipula]
MSRPLSRRFSGINQSQWDPQDSPIKDKTEKEDTVIARSPSSHGYLSLKFPTRLLSTDSSQSKLNAIKSGFTVDSLAINRQRLTLLLLRIGLLVLLVLALVGSFWWTITITSSSRGHVYHEYRRLQEQLILDLWHIGELSLGSPKSKEFRFCAEESENLVPCYNISESLDSGYSNGEEYERHCGYGLRQNCLVVPPVNYKIPLRWPTGRDVIWVGNVRITAEEVLSSGSFTKRMMMLDEEQISFRSASLMFDGVEDYSHQIAGMIGLRNESNFIQIGVRTILDIGCGYGSFGAHLFSQQLLTMCIARYEASGSQVQLTLERGLPAMIVSIIKNQLPCPSLSYDMVHCAKCGVDWDKKDGLYLLEVDRVLRPGGYFVWTSPLASARSKENQKRWNFIRDFAVNLCWELLSQQDETVVWKKTSKRGCYYSRKPGAAPVICSKGNDAESGYYRTLQNCIGGTRSRRWIPIEDRPTWPSRAKLNAKELQLHGLHSEDLAEDSAYWNLVVRDYWSLLSPLIFSDHPKRPGDEDPSPPYNMVRNVLDMNARFGGFNSALLDTKRSVWVMNVVPINGPDYLPLILDRGFAGVLHDWCEAFPSYPRSYDMVHADGLLTLETRKRRRCSSILDLFVEIDRLLRPEGWLLLRDSAALIESTRGLTKRLKWETRIMEIESNNDQRLLVCQKPFIKRLPK